MRHNVEVSGMKNGMKVLNSFNSKCDVCRTTFRRESDKARHKCISEEKNCIHQQAGAIQCLNCERWLNSKGGLKYTGAGQAQQCDI